ncbi:NAD-dependent epimerase/dehydratase family protein [Sphingobacterium multivorum]|uniref:NAD-dependent epimerase/dehydratase family protein n=1 Tax=Sphingobacterium multivorum TaxID=28454 RepID=UPI003DA40FCD
MIIVIGSSGFIGRNLLKNFNAKGVSLRDHDWKENFKDAGVVVNLIGKAHDHKGVLKEEDYQYANVELTKQIFDVFKISKAKLLIHISSLAALEEIEYETSLTEINKCNPISFYGKSKRSAEEWLLEQDLPSDKKLIIIRPPMVHGAGDKGNLGLLYKLISKGIPYPLASFNNQRSFISIDNFCFFIEQIIEKQDTIESGLYHISDDEVVSTKEIIAIIKTVTNSNVPNVMVPKLIVNFVAKIGDVLSLPLNTIRLKKMTSNLVVSNQKIKTTLGISKLPYTAKEGLEKTIRSFKNA